MSNRIGLATIAGTTLLFAGGMLWVFIDPALHGPGYWISTMGVLLVGAAVLVTIWHVGVTSAPHATVKAPKTQLTPLAH